MPLNPCRRVALRACRMVATACIAIGIFASSGPAGAQSAEPGQASTASAPGTVLLTIFLKHDESKPLSEINKELQGQGFFKAFPPPGTTIVSWYVMMGIGQVVTLQVPADTVREVHRAIEDTAWGGFRTEFYLSYDYKNDALKLHDQATKP